MAAASQQLYRWWEFARPHDEGLAYVTSAHLEEDEDEEVEDTLLLGGPEAGARPAAAAATAEPDHPDGLPALKHGKRASMSARQLSSGNGGMAEGAAAASSFQPIPGSKLMFDRRSLLARKPSVRSCNLCLHPRGVGQRLMQLSRLALPLPRPPAPWHACACVDAP